MRSLIALALLLVPTPALAAGAADLLSWLPADTATVTMAMIAVALRSRSIA